jgi:hypothetical protein
MNENDRLLEFGDPPGRNVAIADFGPAGGPEPGVLNNSASLVAQRLPIAAENSPSEHRPGKLQWVPPSICRTPCESRTIQFHA